MKKLLAILLAMLMICSLFVGCAKTEEPAVDEAPVVDAPVDEDSPMAKYGFDKLDLVCFNGGNVGMWDEMVALFLEYYPGVEVTTDFSDDVANRIRARMMTDTPPDFVASSGEEWNMSDSARAGQLMDLTDFYNTGVNADGTPLTEVLPADTLASSYVDDLLVTLPTGTTYLGWWYNVGMFEELGIKAPTTWDELYAAAEVLNENGIIPLMYQNPSYGYWGLSNQMMAVWGGMDAFNSCYITLDEGAWTSEGALAAITAQEELVKAGILSELSCGADFAAAQVDFVNGRVAMITNGTWFENEMADSLPEGFDMAFIPVPAAEEGGNRAVVSIVSGGGQIPTYCANPEAAKAFIGVMLSDAGQAIIAKYGSMPISTAMDPAVVAEIMTPANLSALEAAQEDDVLVLPFVEGYYGDMNTELRSCNDDLCLGDVDAAGYCERMEAMAEQVRNDPEVTLRTLK